MIVYEWYVTFHPRATLGEILTGEESFTSMFGHVEAYGATHDGTWVFFDPRSRETIITVTHRYEDVVRLIRERHDAAHTILRMKVTGRKLQWPFLRPHFNCVTQIAALFGLRAYTPAGLRAMLLRNNAEIIHGNAERRPSSQT